MTKKLGSKSNPIVIVTDPFDWHYRGYLHNGAYCEGYAHSAHTDVESFVGAVLQPLGFVEVTHCEVIDAYPKYKAAE